MSKNIKFDDFDIILKQTLKQRIKDKLYDIYFRARISLDVFMGYAATDGQPLKCYKCKSTETEDYNVDTLDGYGTTVLEYSTRCEKCKTHLGHWSYGNWQL